MGASAISMRGGCVPSSGARLNATAGGGGPCGATAASAPPATATVGAGGASAGCRTTANFPSDVRNAESTGACSLTTWSARCAGGHVAAGDAAAQRERRARARVQIDDADLGGALAADDREPPVGRDRDVARVLDVRRHAVGAERHRRDDGLLGEPDDGDAV